jgi:hypothetical protein
MVILSQFVAEMKGGSPILSREELEMLKLWLIEDQNNINNLLATLSDIDAERSSDKRNTKKRFSVRGVNNKVLKRIRERRLQGASMVGPNEE